jgi:hypothetical protein
MSFEKGSILSKPHSYGLVDSETTTEDAAHQNKCWPALCVEV